MKLKYLFFAALASLGFTACSDFLDVDSVSKYDSEGVFGEKTEINRALNGVYAKLMSGDFYGDAYFTKFVFNSDVEFTTNTSDVATNNSFRRFDGNSTASDVEKFWNAAYSGVEYANNFVYYLERSSLYSTEDAEIMQMMGEAKVIRAMFFHDLVTYFGDIPFTFEPASVVENYVMPIVSRDEVYKTLIEDLKSIAPYMKFAANLSNGVERASKEFCWSMIARMAMHAGGYSLRPDTDNPANFGKMERPANYKDLYKTALAYCDSVISSATHTLSLPYYRVFVNECNYVVNSNDDPIFEIPFAKETSGNVGYVHGPKSELYEGSTSGDNIWGEAKSSAALSAFYRFMFDPEDARRDYLNGLWGYLYNGKPTISVSYTVYNNKWSKLWSTSGNPESAGNTGINFPYMRYTDVLLMYAEAANELNDGPTDAAKAALRQVRQRAFTNPEKIDSYIESMSGSKEDFLKAVLDERKFEFAGENMRWKDLVRNNLLAENTYYNFLRYLVCGENGAGQSAYQEMVEEYDGMPEYLDKLPSTVYYMIGANPQTPSVFPNTSLRIIDIYNPYDDVVVSTVPDEYRALTVQYPYAWASDAGVVNAQCLYSFYGYIYCDQISGLVYLNTNGKYSTHAPSANASLPPVRYILPYPNAAIQRSAGAYKNYYGYTK
ncbi:MAG: RagB/SusD family nutrient uptake outer membrane protein [Bacteroides sp.]|uniref:RagB/SusD family nutrient uptake outer membrane protein n=1 Tax=Bacteroides sp. TaxID=29523 RepID=UPI0025BCE295|nr:RagB/SusD family nutrient uptake outer membrane protein [Bacteroides sp.]MBS6239339.1 RagB/SusD family nutrient uptake outer membrane protein [Bacteroides sp.]